MEQNKTKQKKMKRTFHLDVQGSEQVFQLTLQGAHGVIAFLEAGPAGADQAKKTKKKRR